MCDYSIRMEIYDIYNNDRFADFMIENGAKRIAIEIDDEASHKSSLLLSNRE